VPLAIAPLQAHYAIPVPNRRTASWISCGEKKPSAFFCPRFRLSDQLMAWLAMATGGCPMGQGAVALSRRRYPHCSQSANAPGVHRSPASPAGDSSCADLNCQLRQPIRRILHETTVRRIHNRHVVAPPRSNELGAFTSFERFLLTTKTRCLIVQICGLNFGLPPCRAPRVCDGPAHTRCQ
jgi:hypothetical protein